MSASHSKSVEPGHQYRRRSRSVARCSTAAAIPVDGHEPHNFDTVRIPNGGFVVYRHVLGQGVA